MAATEQLLLNLHPRSSARLGDFAAADHTLLRAALTDMLVNPAASLLYLHGEPGCGRSHLLAALCAEAQSLGLSAALLPLATLREESPALLDGLEGQDLLVLDDVDHVAGDSAWEEALFHLFNRAHAAGSRLVFSAAQLPSRSGFCLPDLVSRLNLAPLWELGQPDDAGREAMLVAGAGRRGLLLEPDLLRYLVQRGPRGSGRLLALLERLDQQSLVAGRRLTIPFVRPLLEQQGRIDAS